jgi:hypothetical protein
MKRSGFLVWVLAAAATGLSAADTPRLFFSKTFVGSMPPYVEITLDKAGKAEYREAPNEEDPLVSQLTEEDTKQIWSLAEQLDWFRKPLESGLPVAKMGDKVLRVEGQEPKGETKFNYTQDETGKLLQDWFERISESAQHRIRLENTARFDKLGVNKALLQLQAAWDRNRIVAPQQFLPMLDRVAKNEAYLHMARERAAALADVFRNGPKVKTTE